MGIMKSVTAQRLPTGTFPAQIFPLAARIFAVVDVFDALTSDRVYRSAMSREYAITYIQEQSGKHFDPMIVDLFLQMILEESESNG